MTEMENLKTPLDSFYDWESKTPHRVYLRQPVGEIWIEYTYADVGQQARALAQFIVNQNFPQPSQIAILSRNSAYWIIADLAIWMSGHVSVPIYPAASRSTIDLILEHSNARFLFLGPSDGADSKSEAFEIPMLHLGGSAEAVGPCYWDVVTQTKPISGSPTRDLNEVATIIYTSGTTGQPRGVVHSFKNMAAAAKGILTDVFFGPDDRLFSYLTMAHVAERLLIEVLSLYAGASVSFCENQSSFSQNIRSVQPTVLLAVPRVWHKLREATLIKIGAGLFTFLMRMPVASTLFKMKIRKSLGLSHARILVTGSAATPVELINWWLNLGLPLQEAYGMTENFAYSHFVKSSKIKSGWVGQTFPGVKTRIAEDGEILVQSPATMIGYYRDPAGTEQALIDSYLRTGDQGEEDQKGNLRIVGRLKDFFKTAKGKFVVPYAIEESIMALGYFENACVVGANLSQPIAIATLSPELHHEEQRLVRERITANLEALNRKLENHEKIQKVVVVANPWTVENNCLTPTLKLRRSHIEKQYQRHFEGWESNAEKVLFLSENSEGKKAFA